MTREPGMDDAAQDRHRRIRLGVGALYGLAVGVAIGALLGHVGAGIALGLAVGVVVGLILYRRLGIPG